MSNIRPFIGDTFDGKVTVTKNWNGDDWIVSVEQADDTENGHLWTYVTGSEEDAQGIYETLLSMKGIDEEYIEDLGFVYI